MTATDLLSAARARGATFRLVGGLVRVEGPVGALDGELRSALRAHRDELRVLVALGLLLESFPGAHHVCAACAEPMPVHANAFCFCCDLGLDRSDFPTKLMPLALELRDRLGPAGARGFRVAAIRDAAALEATEDVGKSDEPQLDLVPGDTAKYQVRPRGAGGRKG